jgi:exonuclease III
VIAVKTILKLLLLTLTLLNFTSFVYANKITIATFNCEFLTTPKVHIKHGLPFDIKKATQQQQQAWANPDFRNLKYIESAKEVAKVILSIQADIITLTEVGDARDISILANELKSLGLSYDHVAVGNSKDKITHQNVAILSKIPLLNLISPIPGRESYLEELDDPETEKNTGISKGLRVTVSINDKNIILYALHFPSERGGHEKDMQRIAQSSIIRRHMLTELNNNKLIIITGDFNDKRGQPTLKRIRGFDDIFPDLIQTGLPKYFTDEAMDTRWTYRFQGTPQQIDHILLSYGVKDAVKRSGIKTKTINHNNAKASDHNPLVVTLDFKE